MKSEDDRDAENVVFGSTLSNDRHAGAGFDYMVANPPYGKDWKRDQDSVRDEHDRGAAGRFAAGLPRISDGQLLFLLHMLAHVRSRAEGGARPGAARHEDVALREDVESFFEREMKTPGPRRLGRPPST